VSSLQPLFVEKFEHPSPAFALHELTVTTKKTMMMFVGVLLEKESQDWRSALAVRSVDVVVVFDRETCEGDVGGDDGAFGDGNVDCGSERGAVQIVQKWRPAACTPVVSNAPISASMGVPRAILTWVGCLDPRSGMR